MNKHRKNNANRIFEHCIQTLTTNSHAHPEKQPLLDYPSIVLGMRPPPSYSQSKRVDDQTRAMLETLKDYQTYYLRVMENERIRYETHFQQMRQMISYQQQIGLSFIIQQIQRVRQLFDSRRICITNVQKNLERKEYREMRVEKKLECLKHEMVFEVPLVKIQLCDLTNFRQDIKKYIITPDQLFLSDIESSQQDSRHTTERDSLNYQQEKCRECRERREVRESREQATQTEYACASVTQQPDAGTDSDVDELLCCEEEIGRRVSRSSRRRRKYAVGRRDVIREEDEWEESNSIISES